MMQSVLLSSFRSSLPRLMSQEYLYAGPGVQLEFVRWKKGRKPSYLGIAKTKRFLIRPRFQVPEVEEKEYSRIRRQWYTYVRSLWFFQQNLSRTKEEESRAHAKEISEDGEIEKLIEEIERDNERVRGNRELALMTEREELAKSIVDQRTQLQLLESERNEQIKLDIEQKINKLQGAITPETLDLVIEKAIENPVDPNFGIDKDGNVYFGRRNYQNPEKQGIQQLNE